MFGQVLEKLDNYFGRSFLVARYFPWLLCVAINLAIASIEFPAVRAHLLEEYTALAASPASKAIDFALVMLTIWAVAYATAPIVQTMTEILEGGWIGKWVGPLLIVSQARRREKREDAYKAARKRRDDAPNLDAVKAQWRRDRAAGAVLRAISDPDAITQAATLIETLRQQRWLNEPVSRADFQAVEDALSVALRNNCADARQLREPVKRQRNPADMQRVVEQVEQAKKLAALHEEMALVLAPYVLDISEQIENRAQLRLDREFAKSELAPTQLGNDAAALRSYCETRYGISFDLFWPRFLLSLKKDDGIADTIATAKIQLDFSILTLVLTIATIAIWAVVIWYYGHSLWSVLIVYVLGPPMIAVWLYNVHASYGAFADLARGAIDMRRFDVLDALRRPLPPSTDAEKRIWEDFTRLAVLGERKPDVTFRHPASK
jgi:hypothetical protein